MLHTVQSASVIDSYCSLDNSVVKQKSSTSVTLLYTILLCS